MLGFLVEQEVLATQKATRVRLSWYRASTSGLRKDPPLTMKAIVYRKAGPPSVLEVATDWPQPERANNQVKVKIFATSVNPIDFKARAGKAFPYLLKIPHVSSHCQSVHCLPPGRFPAWQFFLCAYTDLQQANVTSVVWRACRTNLSVLYRCQAVIWQVWW